MTEMITTSNLTKYYGKSRGIIDLNLSVEEGEVFGFIGPNGAGKSTTMRVLLGLVSPTSGSARIFGKEVGKEQKEILSKIGYLPSEAMFYSGMKVSEILTLSSKLYKKDCVQERKRLCDRFSLDQNRKVEELSLGNRKKVAIVCAFQHKPELLMLDEPTSGLDPLMQKEFFGLLQERNKEGAGILLSSHVLSEVQQYCKRAAILREGRLVACDSVERLAGKNCRKIEIKGINKAPKLDGVRKAVSGDGQVSFLYHGQMQELIAELSKLPVEDLRITEPELEEIFLHYYTEGGERA
ncbi:MAG: ABC transporter ATP-binding protein [Eubacteriales bacterium]|nr:ABC transporter ATP-binding protein [Eubacteriales bacterium]